MVQSLSQRRVCPSDRHGLMALELMTPQKGKNPKDGAVQVTNIRQIKGDGPWSGIEISQGITQRLQAAFHPGTGETKMQFYSLVTDELQARGYGEGLVAQNHGWCAVPEEVMQEAKPILPVPPP